MMVTHTGDVPNARRIMPTVVVLLPSTTYRAADFVAAAAGLDVDLIVASEHPPAIDMGDRYLQVDCREAERAAATIVGASDRAPIDGVVAADDAGVVVAALAARALGLPGNDPGGAAATRDKAQQRRLLGKAEVPQPRHRIVGKDDPPPADLSFPVVVKPLDRTAGQGVLRAEDAEDLALRIKESRSIVGDGATLLVEEFAPGVEVALEGLVSDGALTTLAVFDKPDATAGPAFPETILVTPSTLEPSQLSEVERVAGSALTALGIAHGPVHIEMKVEGDRVSVIEVAARSVGGLCSRSLNFGLMNTTLETLILRNALAMDKPELHREAVASGVLMIPIPRSGTFRGLVNEKEVRALASVTGIELSVVAGEHLDPTPVGDRYLGFVFARATSRREVVEDLRATRDMIEVIVE